MQKVEPKIDLVGTIPASPRSPPMAFLDMALLLQVAPHKLDSLVVGLDTALYGRLSSLALDIHGCSNRLEDSHCISSTAFVQQVLYHSTNRLRQR